MTKRPALNDNKHPTSKVRSVLPVSNNAIEDTSTANLIYLFIDNDSQNDYVDGVCEFCGQKRCKGGHFHFGYLASPKKDDRKEVDEWILKTLLVYSKLGGEDYQPGTSGIASLIWWVHDNVSQIKSKDKDKKKEGNQDSDSDSEPYDPLDNDDAKAILQSIEEKFPGVSPLETIKTLNISKWVFFDSGPKKDCLEMKEELQKFTEAEHCIIVGINNTY
jgi:hypothetical protein